MKGRTHTHSATLFLAGGLSVGIFAGALLFGCQSTKEKIPQRTIERIPSGEAAYVIAHSGEALGVEQIPVWLQTYIASGVKGLESLPDYEASYCFVIETRGNNPVTVETWLQTELLSRSIAQMAADRLQFQFLRISKNNPKIYGGYYDIVLEGMRNTVFSGMHRINGWWVLGRFRQPGTDKPVEEYRAYVFFLVEKQVLNAQIRRIMTPVISPADASEREAIDRIFFVFDVEGLG
jgi:hypothetical protein